MATYGSWVFIALALDGNTSTNVVNPIPQSYHLGFVSTISAEIGGRLLLGLPPC